MNIWCPLTLLPGYNSPTARSVSSSFSATQKKITHIIPASSSVILNLFQLSAILTIHDSNEEACTAPEEAVTPEISWLVSAL